ncbi:MAG: radical SAM protein [Nitrospinae bacterium]|nr:radical SAM protein [Nitrospinota bacterium]
MFAGYLSLYKSGDLKRRIQRLLRSLIRCTLCPRACGVNRIKGETGYCRAGYMICVNTAQPHMGEEPVLSGSKGAGTIFFSHCNLRCIYCQNYQISQLDKGYEIDIKTLAGYMLSLQDRGCHNIELVSPSHYIPQIMEALYIAIPMGLNLPIVYNSNGYDSVSTLRYLEGIVDIYLPDVKYSRNETAYELSNVKDYVDLNHRALKEMHHQVGSRLFIDSEGIARRGLIIRHLVLPGHLIETREILRSIRNDLGNEVHISLMGQYFPTYKGLYHPDLKHPLTSEEYEEAVAILEEEGFENGWIQSLKDINDDFRPDFDSEDVFKFLSST